MRAVTLIQPWAWAICHANKRVENRTWAPPRAAIGKPLAIHAGKSYSFEAVKIIFDTSGLLVPSTVAFGAVVAVATLADVVHTETDLPDDQWDWYCGPFGWVLEDVQVLPEPVPCRGALSLWELPPAVEAAVRTQMREAVAR